MRLLITDFFPLPLNSTGEKGSFIPTWNALKRLVATGKTRAVGVSNFSINDLKDIIPHAADVPISCNQIEVHPWLPNNELISFMRDHGILATCYSPFAGQQADGKTLLKDPTVVKLADENAVDIGQLLQSWAVQRGTVPLGKSQTECECFHPASMDELIKICDTTQADMSDQRNDYSSNQIQPRNQAPAERNASSARRARAPRRVWSNH